MLKIYSSHHGADGKMIASSSSFGTTPLLQYRTCYKNKKKKKKDDTEHEANRQM